jgi:hypothetical protein
MSDYADEQKKIHIERYDPRPQSETKTYILPHKLKPMAFYQAWWRAGVAAMAKRPLDDWKTDNPNHPNYGGRESARKEE